MGFPLKWTTLIAEHDPPRRFVDLQLRGPYSLWTHTHTFAANEGGTLVTDLVRYALLFGPLGGAAHSLVVKRQLREILSFRQQMLA